MDRPTLETLILSLASAAWVQLGRVPGEPGDSTLVNLTMARHSIEMLAMLSDKTEGNRTAAESELLRRLLHDLRMAWVEEQRTQADDDEPSR